mmetsp:Transcript_25428/g.70849  ORF Transcript_25428/g.70849 Transcript_25428/m.70849 type:complete len:220 (-) Transcript_25428:1226-1885(-)
MLLIPTLLQRSFVKARPTKRCHLHVNASETLPALGRLLNLVRLPLAVIFAVVTPFGRRPVSLVGRAVADGMGRLCNVVALHVLHGVLLHGLFLDELGALNGESAMQGQHRPHLDLAGLRLRRQLHPVHTQLLRCAKRQRGVIGVHRFNFEGLLPAESHDLQNIGQGVLWEDDGGPVGFGGHIAAALRRRRRGGWRQVASPTEAHREGRYVFGHEFPAPH